MMKKYFRVEYIIALFISVGFFNSCTQDLIDPLKEEPVEAEVYFPRIQTAAGNYLAGKVALLRQDLNKAADYYAKAVDLGVDKPEIVGQTYLLFTSKGRIDEAQKYAQLAFDQGDKSYIINLINMSYYMAHQDYQAARDSLDAKQEKVYKKIIFPPFYAWIAAGEGNREKALQALKPMLEEEQLQAFYYMHTGLINEYFGETAEAAKAYDTVVHNDNIELSFRSLQIIGNFYALNGRMDEAISLVKKYEEKNDFPVILTNLRQQLENQHQSSQKLIDTPQKGLAEALFNTGTAFRAYQSDMAQVYTLLSVYLNPLHDVARVSLADLMEMSGRPEDACQIYTQIQSDSPIFFMAYLKAVSIYLSGNNHQEALKLLRVLHKRFPKNYEVLFNMGEIYRITDKQEKAIKYYQQALDVLSKDNASDWTILYAMGISYERNDEWNKAEEVLQQALKISNRHPLVLNYIGYSWLKNNKNPNEALYMIFEAYRQDPEDGYIMDSVGWALFKMGKYDDAVKVLERAAEHLPDNAVICDHLGDAYWQIGRKNEAEYQWKHALSLKDENKEIDRNTVQRKLSEGMKRPAIIPFNESLLVERLKTLKLNY